MKWTWDKFGYFINESRSRGTSAETQLLGCILLRPDACVEIARIVSGEHFRDDRNRLLFDHLTRMFATRGMVDVTSLVSRLKNSGDYDRIGGVHYLAKVVQSVPNAAHAEYYAQRVRDDGT